MGVLFMNPTRRSLALWTITPDDYDTFTSTSDRDLERLKWSPECRMIHEFSVAPLQADPATFTQVYSMDDAVRAVFSMGFGPCPLYRRACVLVLGTENHVDEYEIDDENDVRHRIGCIVSHNKKHPHGCVHCEFKQCYLCPQNPFYEVYFGMGSYTADLDGGIAKTTRMLPAKACEAVVAVGTKVIAE